MQNSLLEPYTSLKYQQSSRMHTQLCKGLGLVDLLGVEEAKSITFGNPERMAPENKRSTGLCWEEQRRAERGRKLFLAYLIMTEAHP